MTTQTEALELALEAFKKIRDDQYSHWEVDQEIAEIELSLAQPEQEPVVPKHLDVRRIILDIVPGDGSGFEVHAKTVDDVEALLTKMSERIEELEASLAAAPQPAPVQQEPVAWAWRFHDEKWVIGFEAPWFAERSGYEKRPLVFGDTTPPQRKPLTPVVPDGADINQRVTFKAGWRSAEAAHGINE